MSTPTSITVVATSTSALPRRERAIAAAFSAGRIWPWSSVTRKSAARRREPLVLGGRGTGLERLGLLDERADDERLAPGAQLLADPLVGAGALALAGRDVRGDRPAALRQLAQLVTSRSP